MSYTLASNTNKYGSYNPIHFVGGNYYHCFVGGSGGAFTLNKVYMSKASSITGPWVVQDSTTVVPSSANTLTGTITRRCLTTLTSSSGRIHVAYAVNSDGQVFFSTFNTSTDTWKNDFSAGTFIQIEGISAVHAYQYISLTQRGNDDIIATYMGGTEAVMGDDKLRVDYNYSTDDGDTWLGTVGVAVDDGGDIHYGNIVCAPGSQSTDAHFLYQRQTDVANDPPVSWADLQGKTLSTTSLSTAVTTAGAGTGDNLRGLTNAVGFDTGTVWRVVVGGSEGTTGDLVYSRADEDGSNDLQAPVAQIEAATSPTIAGANEASTVTVIRDSGGDIHWLYSDSTLTDIYAFTSTDDGDSLISSTATEIFGSVSASSPSANILDGYGFLVVWQEGTSTVYDFNNVFSQNAILSPTPFSTGLAGAGTALTITNVNTTDEWDDGDTNIPATGTGFYTAP